MLRCAAYTFRTRQVYIILDETCEIRSLNSEICILHRYNAQYVKYLVARVMQYRRGVCPVYTRARAVLSAISGFSDEVIAVNLREFHNYRFKRIL